MHKRADCVVIGDRPYVVDEALEDGRLVLRPDTSIEAISARQDTEAMTAKQFHATFGELPTDSEG